MPAPCLFCQIAGRARSASIVMEDDLVLAFLDHRPLFPGHCLLIPKAHVETLGDLPHGELGPFFASVQLLARAVETGLAADSSFVAITTG